MILNLLVKELFDNLITNSCRLPNIFYAAKNGGGGGQ